MPREGHMQQVYHIFAYLKAHQNVRIMLDPSYPTIMEDDFPEHDWKNFYKVEEEVIPPNSPEPQGLEFIIRWFLDVRPAG